MRNLRTLYKIVLEQEPLIIRDNISHHGICHMILYARYVTEKNRLSSNEMNKLMTHLHSLRPMREEHHPFAKFAWDISYNWNSAPNTPRREYWWSTDERGREQRFLFLKALIEYTTPWYVKLWRELNYFDVFTRIYMKQ